MTLLKKTFNSQIVEYYDETTKDYLLGWTNETDLALHYGIWEPGVKNRREAILNENKCIVELAQITREDCVLDAGCGLGGTSIWIAREIGAKVTGITLSEKQVTLASIYAKKQGVEKKTTFDALDFTDTSYENDKFHTIIAIESSCQALVKDDFITESYRILRNDGRLIVADYFLQEPRLKGLLGYFLRVFLKSWAMPGFETIENFEKKLKKKGFFSIRLFKINRNILKSSRFMFITSLLWLPYYVIALVLKWNSKVQINNIIGGICQYLLFKSQKVVYCIFHSKK